MSTLSHSQPLVPGAFGLKFLGLNSPRLLAGPPESWALIHVHRGRSDGELEQETLGNEYAAVQLFDVQIKLDRQSSTATFLSPRSFADDDLLHPYLSVASAIFARWLGREGFHSGAFVANDGAWGILGTNQAGKSTLAAYLALAGFPVVADDLLVLEAETALTGPRFIDLREPTASALDSGDRLAPSRWGTRRRLALPSMAPEVPLRGWVFLEWGASLDVRPVPVAERLSRLSQLRAVLLPPTDPALLLKLASLPTWELRRPRDLQALPRVVDRLVELAQG